MAKTAVCSSLPDTSVLCYQSQDAMYGVNGINLLSMMKEWLVSRCDSMLFVCLVGWSVGGAIVNLGLICSDCCS